MPHYHFHLRDSRNGPDGIGLTLPDLNEAKREALSMAGLLLATPEAGLSDRSDWSIDVTDGRGRRQFTLTFFATLGQALAARVDHRADDPSGTNPAA